MRLAFFLLLLANLALFAWGQGYLGAQEAGREPGRMQRQIEPERLQLLPAGTTPTPPAPAAIPLAGCKQIEWLSAAEATAVRTALADLPEWRIDRNARPAAPAHWVLIPSLSSRAQAEKKNAELRQLGVESGEIVEDATHGPFVVSIRLFRERPAAEELMKTLTKKGARSAQLVQRTSETEQFSLELRAPADALDRRLPDLIATLPQASLLDCANP
jgi:hypothetical protein